MTAAAAPAGWLHGVVDHLVNVSREKLQWGSMELMIMIVPQLVYWAVAGIYFALDCSGHPAVVKYRIVRKDSDGRPNLASPGHVFRRVLLQHVLQLVVGFLLFFLDPGFCDARPYRGPAASVLQFLLGMFVMDTWQYFIHRWVHTNKWLYKHVHSVHHELLVPYAYGALYNHPVEAIVLDTVGAIVSHYASGAACSVALSLFCVASAKTVLDHCGYRFPINPVHDLFPNSAAYHDVHHDLRGIKRNFSQPFFTHWDILLGTYTDPAGWHIDATSPAGKAAAKAAKAAAACVPDTSTTGAAQEQGAVAAAGGVQRADSAVLARLRSTAAAKQQHKQAAANGVEGKGSDAAATQDGEPRKDQ